MVDAGWTPFGVLVVFVVLSFAYFCGYSDGKEAVTTTPVDCSADVGKGYLRGLTLANGIIDDCLAQRRQVINGSVFVNGSGVY
jgi:hypothetical protein